MTTPEKGNEKCGFALTAVSERDNMKLTEYTSRFLPPTFLMGFSESEGLCAKISACNLVVLGT